MLLSALKTSVLLPFALAGVQDPGTETDTVAEEAEAAADESAQETTTDIVVEGEIDQRQVKKCRYVRGINSRIPKKICRTQAEDEAYERAAQRQLEDMQDGQRAREMADINNPG